jgi:hypothetical protein
MYLSSTLLRVIAPFLDISQIFLKRRLYSCLQNCQSGVWSAAAGKPKLSTFTLTHYGSSFNYSNVGIHDFCTSQYGNENDRDDSWRGVQLLGDGSWQIAVKDGSETIMCLDW